MEKKRNQKGFTLAELLIVVAIIAVLVAIAIPIFTAQLEKSREATDLANLRSAYAEVMTAGLTEDSANYTKTVKAKQAKDEWQSTNLDTIGGIPVGNASGQIEAKTNGAEWTVQFNATDQTVSIGGVSTSVSSGSN